jgi:nicotinamide-nucleotide amidase
MDVSERLAARLGDVLRQRELTLVAAESCTGGWFAKVATSVPGCSAWFDRGFVAYSNAAKADMLGVPDALMIEHGAVSEPAIKAMVEGALAASAADLAIAISGVAGPGGGSPDKPVGTVWIAAMLRDGECRARVSHYAGDRAMIRQQAVMAALQSAVELAQSLPVQGSDDTI